MDSAVLDVNGIYTLDNYRFTHLPFKIIPEANLLLVKVKNKLLFEELVWHPSEFMAHEDFKSGVNILYDLRAIAEVTGDLEMLLSSIDRLKEEAFIPVPAKTVFCTSPTSPQVMKCLQGICIMTRGSRVEHEVVEELAPALVHLSIDENQLSWIESELAAL